MNRIDQELAAIRAEMAAGVPDGEKMGAQIGELDWIAEAAIGDKVPSPQLNIYGEDLFGHPIQPPLRGKLAEAFLIPPFSVLNAREGWWQERKKAWISLGIKSELGRDSNHLHLSKECESYRTQSGSYTKETASLKGGLLMGTSFGPYDARKGSDTEAGTSVFDPTLTELAYRWFCPPKGQIVDPFAGGSVRGIVASVLGFNYWGSDLSARQIEQNNAQALNIQGDCKPVWVCGDSMDTLENAPQADFIFSCPPYGDLEVYSEDERDLSTMDYHAFTFALRRIIAKSCEKLKPNRFAALVVGDFRCKNGFYRNFPADTITSFKLCGMELYNEAVLLTQVGSLPIRVTQQFNVSRKLGKTHQNVLVFVKGDPRKAAKDISATQEELAP